MNTDFWILIATISGPIISAIAIIVALWISHSSSKDARKQIDELHNILEVFVASQTPSMIDALQKLKREEVDLRRRIGQAKRDFECQNNDVRLMGGGALIDKIEATEEAKQKGKDLAKLQNQHKEILQKINLIETYLQKANHPN